MCVLCFLLICSHRDAIQKKHRVLLLVTELTGAISASLMGVLRVLGAQAKEKGALDATAYGTARASTKDFVTHHTATISAAAIQLADALTVKNAAASLRNSPCLTCK